MYFDTKSYLKSNHNHTTKHTLSHKENLAKIPKRTREKPKNTQL